jgi:hypothetical protein
MNARIGATGAMNAHVPGANTSKSLLDMVLNAVAIRLTLPS